MWPWLGSGRLLPHEQLVRSHKVEPLLGRSTRQHPRLVHHSVVSRHMFWKLSCWLREYPVFPCLLEHDQNDPGEGVTPSEPRATCRRLPSGNSFAGSGTATANEFRHLTAVLRHGFSALRFSTCRHVRHLLLHTHPEVLALTVLHVIHSTVAVLELEVHFDKWAGLGRGPWVVTRRQVAFRGPGPYRDRRPTLSLACGKAKSRCHIN